MAHGIKAQTPNGEILIGKYNDMDIANEVRLSLSEKYPDASFIVQQVGNDEVIVTSDFVIPELPTNEPDENEFPDDVVEDDETLA